MKRPQNWNQPCPNTACCHAAQKNQGNLRGIASYMTPSGKRRIFECTTCHVQFAETRGTVFFDLRTPEEKVIMALKMVLVRVSLTKIAFVLGVTEQTVLEWLERAAAQAEKITTALLRDWPVTAGQVEEMWSCVKRKVSTPSDGDPESPQEADDGRQWWG